MRESRVSSVTEWARRRPARRPKNRIASGGSTLRRFYDVKEELPTHYDLVLNTDVISVPAAAQLLIAAAKSI
jgi:hypothetical protein